MVTCIGASEGKDDVAGLERMVDLDGGSEPTDAVDPDGEEDRGVEAVEGLDRR